MSTTETSPIAPEVRLFLARVRHELADLDPEEVAEMTDGLEADLTELIAERGVAALGSPVEYAGELRAAAGLAPQARQPVGRRSVGERVGVWLDAAHARFDALIDRAPGDPAALLAWLRPLWWIVRAWIAVDAGVAILKDAIGLGNPYYAPHLVPPVRGFGWPLLLVAVLASVQIGRGRLWPGRRRDIQRRVLLLGLNVLALALIPVTLASVRNEPAYAASTPYASSFGGQTYGINEQAGVYSGGRWVTNIYPYDASGKPLVGVQLFDQLGHPISVVAAPECADEPGRPDTGWSVLGTSQCYDPMTGERVQGRVSYPWSNGAAQLENVFPLPTRMQELMERTTTAFGEQDPPRIGAFPLASVPPVSLPGITPSVQASRRKAR